MESSKEPKRPKRIKAKPQGVPSQDYYAIFQGRTEGQRILEELSTLFHDRPLETVDPSAALFREGQRSVVMYIIHRCAEVGA